MFVYSTKIRVRYAETDQMGYMYHGNYAQFYEVRRVEMLRSFGSSYRAIEESGIIMPVVELRCKFIRPARYDEEIEVRVILAKLPGLRMHFTYELYNESGVLINIGETSLAFVNTKINRPCHAPEDFLNKFKAYFEHS